MIFHNINLKKLNTFGLDYRAEQLVDITSEEEAISIFKNKNQIGNNLFILGGGSNLLFTEDFNGTLLRSKIDGISVEESRSDYVIVSCGAGVVWDDMVAWSVNNNLGGLENLSYIPGLAGAAPVQNIGAYGVEIKDLITRVRAISVTDGSVTEFNKTECNFNYRNSIFKNINKGKYLVTRVYLKLSKNPDLKLEYGALKDEVKLLGELSPANIRTAVIKIRKSKLPDPEVLGNAGSFFKNPVVNSEIALNLKSKFPSLPVYDDLKGHKKLAAGWLIENSGWKGRRIGDAGVHENQALVLVNLGNATGMEIFNLSEKIRQSVNVNFGVNLEREVEVIGSI